MSKKLLDVPHGAKALAVDDPRLMELNIHEDKVYACVTSLLEGLNCPTSLGISLCIKYGDMLSAVSHEADPSKYNSADSFFTANQACKILSKFVTRIPGLDPERAASETFASCEKACQASNEFWYAYSGARMDLLPKYEALHLQVRDQIADILGDLDLEEWLNYSRLGPGLVAFGPRSNDDVVKLSTDVSVTARLAPYLPALWNEFPGWSTAITYGAREIRDTDVKVVNGGKYCQVLKNAKTNRNIETQPTVNLFLQLGLGQCIRNRLTESGNDIQFQTRNQVLAHRGSVTGKIATIDLSNASDMIARGVIEGLIPPKWLHALRLIRTSSCYKDGVWYPLERFSSMGNGYTFELETLVFLAICRAVCGPKTANISVYGDDIIVPSKYYARVVDALSLYGFRVNPRKSYADGPFRESCGKDFFLGFNTRPYYLKGVPSNVPEVVRVANGLSRIACRLNRSIGLDRRFARGLQQFRKLIPAKLRHQIALGWPDDDSYLCDTRERDGLRIVVETRRRPPGSFYQAKTAMLYRLHTRKQGREEQTDGFSRLSYGRDYTYVYEHHSVSRHYLIWGRHPDAPLDLGFC